MNKPPIYPHPLDYMAGIKYCLTTESLHRRFEINSENFYVEEIIDWNSIGFNKSNGSYHVFKVFKKDMDTFKALEELSKIANIPENNIVFLGLKDKTSTSIQYFFVKKELISNPKDLEQEFKGHMKLSIHHIGYTIKKPRKKHLLGNRFKIKLYDLNDEDLEVMGKIINIITRKGLPSYYGYQRFGVKRFNTHLLGKYLLIKRIDLFIEEFLYKIYPTDTLQSIISRMRSDFDNLFYERIIYSGKQVKASINKILSITKNIFYDAYSAYLYNLLLNNIIEKRGWQAIDRELPMPGCIEYFDLYREIFIVENIIDYMPNNVFKCWFRRGLFRPIDIVFKRNNGFYELSFTLKKGFYASIILRELFKDNLVFTQTLS
jgi:tRNA pseudouridine13 synthase